MKGIVFIGVAAAAMLLLVSAKKNPRGLIEPDVDAEDIREGVKNGWYTCVLITKDGMPAVRLSGKMTNGQPYVGEYTISESDWKALRREGYDVQEQ